MPGHTSGFLLIISHAEFLLMLMCKTQAPETGDLGTQVAQGRLWTGADALKHGLLDDLGGMQQAIETTKFSLGFEEVLCRQIPR